MQRYSLTSNLLTENTALREEVERLKAEVDNIKQVEFPRRVEKLRTGIRKQAARECLKWMIQNRCISETQANNFCCNFELQEGEE